MEQTLHSSKVVSLNIEMVTLHSWVAIYHDHVPQRVFLADIPLTVQTTVLFRKEWFDYKVTVSQGPVVQSIVSLTSSLKGQLVKCFTTLQPCTLIFFVEEILQKLLTFFQQKILAYLRY